MTDKEKIIIGGVDVSKCRFLDVERDKEDYPEMGGRYTAYECILTSRDCECSKDCYYKQLKRKTQECDCYRKALEEIEAATKINCEEICGKNYDTCNDKDCLTKQIIDIVNKVKKGNTNDK